MNEITLFVTEFAIATGLFVGLIFLIMRLRGKEDFRLFLNCCKREMFPFIRWGRR